VKITVVGAGIVGCAIAHELASRGAVVRLIDPRGTGQGATRASAGMLAPHIEGHLPPLRALGVRSLAMYDDFIRRAAADSGQPIEYERAGTLQVARSAAESAELCAMARSLAEAAVPHTLLDAGGLRRMEPAVAADLVSGLHVAGQGYVAATALTHALATAAVKHGAEIITSRVTMIDGGDTPRVVTSAGVFDGDAVVIAAGSWSGSTAIAGSSSRDPAHTAVRPIRGQLIQLRLDSRPASRVIWGSRCYLVPWRDGSVLAGATVEDVGFDESSTDAGIQYLREASAELLPILRGAAVEEVRVGLRPMTGDELPAIGPSSTMRNVFYATGHYRNGVLLAALTASLVADLVLDGGRSPELALVRPDRLGL
jgi:glycine oxidase